jgi:sugar lactone lactonase YvrE
MSFNSGSHSTWSHKGGHDLFDQTSKSFIKAVLVLLVCMCGVGIPLMGQTASYSGVTTAIDTTHFTGPQGIATDASGNLYVADSSKSAVYEMVRTGPGAYNSPVALTGPAGGYTYLRGVAIDSIGNLWVADFANYPSTPGQVYELAYNSTAQTFAAPVPVGSGWESPWAISADALGNVFVTDNSASTISKISGGTVSVVNSTGVSSPRGIAVDSSENLFVIDGNTGRVMEITAPAYTTVAQANPTGFTGPGDIALDANGNIWIAEYTTNLVRELTVADNYATILSWGSGLNGPLAVWPDADGAMLVSDFNNSALKQIATQAVNLGTVALGSTSASQTVAFTFTGSANTTIQPPVVVIQGAAGQDFADAGTGTCTTTNGSGNPYATNTQCSVVVNFQPKVPGIRYGAVELLDTTGNLLAQGLLYGTGTGPEIVFNPGNATTPVTGFSSPQKVAVDGNGNAFVVDAGSSSIFEIPAGGGSRTAIATGYSFSSPYGIAIDGAGNLFVTESGANQIDEIIAAGGYTTVKTLTPKFSGPIGLAVDANGNLYVADASSTHAVEELAAAGGYSVINTLSASFTKPFGVAVDASGNVFVADEGSTTITELVAVNGQVPSSPTVHTYGTFTSPAAVAVDDAGNVYVADNGGGTISELTAASSYATSISLATGVAAPAGIAVDGKGNVYYTTNGTDDSAYELDLADAPTLTFLSSAYQTLSTDSPKSVTISNIGVGASSDLDLSNLVVSTTTTNAADSFAQVAGTGSPADCTSTSTLASGSSCNLSISFTPQYAEAIAGTATLTDNTLSATNATQSIALNGTGVKATPTLTWATPADITYGASLLGVLNATATNGASSVPGSISYTAQLNGGGTATPVTTATVLGAGTYTLSVSFTPTDTSNFNPPSSVQVTLIVDKAPLTVTAANASRAYGAANPTFTATITGFVNGDSQATATTGTPSLTTTATTTSPAGSYPITATIGTLTATNYTFGFVAGTLTIGQTTPTITWATPAAITYGTALSATQLNASSTVAGSLVYTPAAGTVLGVGTQTLSVTLTPTDTTDYSSATQTVQIVVNKATPSITWATPAAISYGTALGATQLNASSTVAGSLVYTPAAGAVLGAGTQTLSVTLTPTDTTDYNNATQTVQLVVNKATPAINWATPAAITYGTALSATQLNASSTVAGSLVYTPASGAVLGAGTQTLSVTLTPTDTTDYSNATQTVQLVVNKATPTITWATPAAILYGTALSATQLNATSTVAGTFAYTPAAGTVVAAGTQTLSVTLTPTDTTDYNNATQTVQLVVNKIAPTITWGTPAAITYGTALSAAQLNATSTVAGTLVYTPAAGTVLGVGTQTLSVTLTPSDSTDYTSATQTVQLVVNKATPTITWATPASITYGTALSATQLDASSTVAGTLVYTPASGTVLAAGTQTLSVTLTPTDTTDYTTATQTVQLVVNKAGAPTITWATPAAITYGTALTAAQLDASSTVAGTFVYTPALGTVLPAGTQTLSVTLNPTDSTDYPTSTQTVQIVVNKAVSTVTWATPAAITYGSALSPAQLNASASVPGTLVYSPSAGTVLSAGTQTLSVTFTPTDSTDYTSVTQTVQLLVNKAIPSITWATPAAISYGTALSATQLDASSTVPGTFVYSPAAGTVLGAGPQTLSVTLTPNDATDYATATQTVQLTVNQGSSPTISWATPASITYGTALSATQLNASSTIPGVFAYTPAAGTVLHAGTQTLSVTFTPTDTTDYPTTTQTVQIVVKQATPSITWTASAAISYGTALSATQLDASSTVAGTLVYTPVAGTVLGAGTQSLSVTLTPTDSTDYTAATQTVSLTVNKASQTITFTPPSSAAYGSAAITLTATGGASGNPVTFTLVSGPATLAGSTLSFSGTGTVVIAANQAGNANYLAATQVSQSISVTGAVLAVSANSASRAYGTPNPTFTGSVTGAVNGDTFTETFSTTATSTSPAGTYPIIPAASGSDLAYYTVNVTNGTLTVSTAGTTTSLTASSASINPGQGVTLTATVASSTTGTPTGTVSFYDGATLLGTGTLSAGTASYTASSLASGSHSITAVYGGDANFATSSTSAAITVTVAALDFTLTVTGPSDDTVKQGASAVYQLQVNPTFGNYPGTVTFAATGLPAGATISFNPSSVAVTGGQQSVTATVETAQGVSSNLAPNLGGKLAPLGLALILLPLAGAKQMRRQGRAMGRFLGILLILGGMITAVAVSGCGSNISKKTNPQSYTITITATGGGVQHSTNVTLEIN